MNTPVKERLIQFIENQGVSIRTFCTEISVSSSYFTKKGAISSDVLEKIVNKYPQLNIDWVLTGKGMMLRGDDTSSTVDIGGFREKYYDVLEKYNHCLESKAALGKAAG